MEVIEHIDTPLLDAFEEVVFGAARPSAVLITTPNAEYNTLFDGLPLGARLRNRSLSKKRSLALREFALGVEGLRRFVEQEPLYRVHECAFAVLALESEPVDPRL